jgi:uncharacterized protein YdeI (YjbR/CyaY-like superfamily)
MDLPKGDGDWVACCSEEHAASITLIHSIIAEFKEIYFTVRLLSDKKFKIGEFNAVVNRLVSVVVFL